MPSRTRRLSTSILVATTLVLSAWRSEAGADFEIGNRIPLTDVQSSTKRTDDKKTATVLFDNLVLELLPGKGAAAVSRVTSIVLPTAGDGSEVEIVLNVHGAAIRTEGATATLLVRLPGRTETVDLPTGQQPADKETGFFHELRLKLRAGQSLPLSLVLLAERDGGVEGASALLAVDSIEAALWSEPAQQ
jgi:hypothetical protein